MGKTSNASYLLALAVAAVCVDASFAKSWLEEQFDKARKEMPTSIPGAVKALETNWKNAPKSLPAVKDALVDGIARNLPEQNCGRCGCLVRSENGRCVACKPKEQCDFAKNFPCSCPSGHISNRDDKQRALRERFCAGHPLRCSPTGCCGGVRYGHETCGTDALNFAAQTAMACVACTAGCGACAGATAQRLIMEELQSQVSDNRCL
jgi:hypothetical protein